MVKFVGVFGNNTNKVIKVRGMNRDKNPTGNRGTEFNYNDPALKKIAIEIGMRRQSSSYKEIHIVEDELTDLTLQDTRFFIATEILFTMICTNVYLQNREYSKEDLLGWIKKIAKNIPDSPRWCQIYRNRNRIFSKFNNLHSLKDNEYRLLNIAERESEFRIFGDAYEMNEQVKKVLSKSLIELGLGVDNINDYEAAIFSLGELLGSLQNSLTEEIKDLYYWKPVRRPKRLSRSQVDSLLENAKKINPEKLILTGNKLINLGLKELPFSFIPIFYECQDEKFRISSKLLQLNNPFVELPLSLPKEKEEIINRCKGLIFEDILVDLLTGKLKIAYDSSELFSGSLSTFDIVNSYRFKDLQEGWRILEYSYTIPGGRDKASVTIHKGTSPTFKKFLNQIGKEGWEEDIVLVHHKSPRHILAGQCKFTNKYKQEEYEDGYNHVKKFAEFIKRSEEAKIELKLPISYPVVPVLFTSFSGRIFGERKDVLMTTFPPILWGKFKEWVNQFLSKINEIINEG